MFAKILFATTVSPTCDDAAKVAFELAKKNDSKLDVFHVLGIPTRGFSPFVTDVRTGESESMDDNYKQLVIEEMKSTYEKQLAGYSATLNTTTGVPHTEVLRKAREIDADLIIMGAHSREDDIGATRFRSIVGSTMQRVAQSARCPVLIVSRPCTTCWSYFSNIVLGVDFTRAAESAFHFAVNVAKEIGCKLHLINVVDVTDGSDGQLASQEEIEKRIADAKAKMEEMYVANMGDFDNYIIEVKEGTAHVEILKYTREVKGDLVMMAHHARNTLPADEALLGSTVEQVVLRSACPVLSVNRPDKVDVEPYGKQPVAAEA